jgi:hypothetical protein
MPAPARIVRHSTDLVKTSGTVSKTTTYSMIVTDHEVLASISGGSWTLTLPPVADAVGRVYTIRVTAAAGAGAAANVLTITHKGDSKYWNGEYRLKRVGHVVVLTSDGERWHRQAAYVGRPVFPVRGFFEDFSTPFSLANANIGGAWRGTAGDLNTIAFASGNTFLMHVKATQTLLGPIWLNPGLNIAQDLTDNDGIEYVAAVVANSGNPTQFTIGTDGPFFCRARFTIADVSGTDDCAVGFRRIAAGQANIDDYTDMAVLNVILGDINIETILNNAATTTTDTTNNWADAETHTLSVFVTKGGVVTYQIDDAAPLVTAAFTFDTGDVIVPFIFFLQATTSPGAVSLLEWECGFQA